MWKHEVLNISKYEKNMKVWKCECDSFKMWKCDNMKKWKSTKIKIMKCYNVGM